MRKGVVPDRPGAPHGRQAAPRRRKDHGRAADGDGEVRVGGLPEPEILQRGRVVAAGAASAVPTYDTPKAEIDDQDYAAGVSNTSLPIAVPYCRPVRLLWDSKTAGITASLLKTSDTVRLNATDSDDADGEVKTEETDAQTVMALSARKTSVNNVSVESDIMVLGSLLIPDYYLMQDNSYNNSQYLVSAVNTMTGKGSGLIITEKTLTDQTLTMTAGDVRGSVVAVFAVPLIVIIVGIVVIARRRNK